MYIWGNKKTIWISKLVNKSFRGYIRRIEERVNLITVSEPFSTNHEMAGVLKELEPVPVLFENVREANFRVVGTYSIS
jgi:3-polyprenyl-4-hydroxybenzoate decarboxylase